jgi:LAO/AO transport system kinase
MTLDLTAVANGDRRAVARALSAIEADPGEAPAERLGPAPVIGITGPPGVGKSTLVNALLVELRTSGKQIAVVAVDPSSPLTGGALLGDRIRMQDHIDDAGVFVRSMAARGHLGGLAPTTTGAVNLLTGAGFDLVIVETVGVGQSEVEIMSLADMVVLVVAPGWGDQIQADKAGVVEIADLFVINKADRDGVESLRRALAEVARSGSRDRPVLTTVATTGEGVGSLAERLLAQASG